jgi:hypothetical protein
VWLGDVGVRVFINWKGGWVVEGKRIGRLRCFNIYYGSEFMILGEIINKFKNVK